jgi:hypothetical protein
MQLQSFTCPPLGAGHVAGGSGHPLGWIEKEARAALALLAMAQVAQLTATHRDDILSHYVTLQHAAQHSACACQCIPNALKFLLLV